MRSEFELDLDRLKKDSRAAAMQAMSAATPDDFRVATLALLDAAVATEWVCVLRYSQHAVAAEGISSEPIAEHFREHAREELEHAHMLAARINQLDGKLNLNPSDLSSRSHAEYKECDSLAKMIRENLYAEQIAVASYRQAIDLVKDKDPTTRRLFEEILAKEEEHADEMKQLLKAFDARERLS